MAHFEKLQAPHEGEAIRFVGGKPEVPNVPIIPYIRGDGTGVDIWPATQKVLDAAVKKAYQSERRIEWFKIYAGDEACDLYGTYQYLPNDTLEAIRQYGIAIKGPLTTPVGGGIRSLNVALRQLFDLYSCVRPCRYYAGTPSPHKRPEDLDVIVYFAMEEEIARLTSAYQSERRIEWFKIYAGDEACDLYGTYQYLPNDTLEAIRQYGIAIKGPLTTPVGGGIRSLNVALRQLFDLYSCVRPCRYYAGTPSPHKRPEDLDVIVYRENTEDIYMGIEWEAKDPIGQKLIDHLNSEVIPANGKLGKRQIPHGSGIGIKPVSKSGSQRHIRRAIQHALKLQGNKRHVTLVHKGNIMKFTEGSFRDWGYELATTEFRDVCITERESWILSNAEKEAGLSYEENAKMIDPGYESLTQEKKNIVCAEVQSVIETIGKSHGHGEWRQMVMVDDRIADSIFQQIQTRPQEYSILATLNLNGDYISDAAAAIVGGLGMAPGANIGDKAAIFEATHGTAPKHAGLDRINPGSVILSGVMMLEFLGWQEAADLVTKGLSQSISDQKVTYDLARLMEPPVNPLSCSGFANSVIERF